MKPFLYPEGPKTLDEWHEEVRHHGALSTYFDHCFTAGIDPELWFDERTSVVFRNKSDYLMLTFRHGPNSLLVNVPWEHPPPPDCEVWLNSGKPSPPHMLFAYSFLKLAPAIRHMAMRAGHDPEFVWADRDGEKR
jgi:hypothetical protein